MEILYPMFVVILLSGVLFLIMAGTRVPSILKYFGNLQAAKHSDDLRPNLPDLGRNITDNYNHLFEQPTLFYAVVLVIWALGHTDITHLTAAWAYCGLRCVHSIVQVTINHVWLRFSLFSLSWVALATMLTREVLAALG